ncbi:unnamed protein product [Aureobasidium pullulans]|nr:unnamed protein product [Aureobasidium pullulans]
MATNTRDESIPQRLTSGRNLPFYLGYIKPYHYEHCIGWLNDYSIYQHDFHIPSVQSLVKESKAPNGLWKSTRKISFDLCVKKEAPGDEDEFCLGIFEDPAYPCTFTMTLALGTWCAQLHHLSETVRRDGQIKRTEVRFKRASSVSDMTGNAIDKTPKISIASTQDHESDHTTRSWLQNPAAQRVDTARAQQPTQMLVDETSDLDLNAGSTALLITNSSSKSGSSAIDAIPIDCDEQTCGDFDDSDIYCSTELHGRLSTEDDNHMVSDRLDRANRRTTEQAREGANDSDDTQPTVQPQATDQPHSEKQADQPKCSNNQTLISEQSWEVFDDGNTMRSPTLDPITRDTSPARKRRRIAEPSPTPSQHSSNIRRAQSPQSDHGDLESSEHIDLSRAILQMINNARSIGHARFLSRRNYDESKIPIKRFVGRHSVPMMLDDDGPKNHLVVMEELRAMKRAIELLTGHW